MGTSQVKNLKPLLCTRNPTKKKLRFDNVLSGDNLVIYHLEININQAVPNRTLCTYLVYKTYAKLFILHAYIFLATSLSFPSINPFHVEQITDIFIF